MKNTGILKSILSIVTLTVVLVFSVISSQSIAQKLEIGISSSFNANTHLNKFRLVSENLDLEFSPSFTTGYSLGLIQRYQLNKNIRFQAEPGFLLTGAHYNDTFQFMDVQFRTDSRTNIKYIHLPVLVQLTTTPPHLTDPPTPWAITTFHVSVGVYGNYLFDADLNGKNRGEPFGVETNLEFSNDIDNQYRNVTGGVLLGGGIEYGNNKKIGFEARTLLGITSEGNAANFKFDPRSIAITIAAYFIL